MKSKQIASWILAVTAMAAVTGCGGADGEAAGSPENGNTGTMAAGQAEKENTDGTVKTLEFFWFSDGAEGEAMRKVLDAYEAEHPDIRVELVEVPYSDINSKIMMSVSGGEPPALARVTEPMQFYDVALDLTSTLGGADAFFADYPSSVRSNTKIYMDDKIYAIPAEASITGMYYNKTAFDQAGVTVPQSLDEVWTWSEFAEKLQTVIDNSDVQYGMVMDYTTQRWSNILYQFGGKFLNEDGSPAFTSEESRNALNFTKDMFDRNLWVKSVFLGGEDANNLFKSGQVAAALSGSWNIGAYKNDITAFECGVTYLPYETEQASFCTNKMFMGFQGTGLEEETKDLLCYLASNEADSYYHDSLFISPRLDGADIKYSEVPEWFEIFAEQQQKGTQQGIFDQGYPGWFNEQNTFIKEELANFVAGNITADEFMKEVDEKTVNILGK